MSSQSKTGRPSLAEAEALTEKILDVASMQFFEKGYAGTSLDAISSAAGISKPTLYRRFADKGVLFAAVLRRRAEDVAVSASQPGQTPLEQLRALGAAMLETLSRPLAIQFLRVVIAEGPRFPELALLVSDPERSPVFGSAMDLIEQAQQEGQLGTGQARWLANTFLFLVWGLPAQRTLMGSTEYASAKARQDHLARAWTLFVTGAEQAAKA